MKRRASQLSISTETTIMEGSAEGHLPVKEGSVYWKLDTTDHEEASGRPTILLIHAGVADHTMWNEQVRFLNGKGWNCLRIDMFGFGNSNASEEYLHGDREPHNPSDHIESIRQHVLGEDKNVIVLGLSVGANLSLAYTLAHPEHVVGLSLSSGGPRGFESQNDPREDRLLDTVESLLDLGDVHGAAQMQVRIWGDGPLQDPGRLPDDIATRMLEWNTDISARECSKRGGGALEQVLTEPAPIARLHTIKIPTAISWGSFDETFTREAMKYVAGEVRGATSKEFVTAHLINLEKPEEFNAFIGEWLQAHFEDEEEDEDEEETMDEAEDGD